MPIPTCSVTRVKCRKVKDPALTGILDTYDNRLATLEKYVNNTIANYVNNGGLTSDVEDIVARTIVADTIITNLLVSNTIVTETLYATYGDIAELTVDYLSTLNKLALYWLGTVTGQNYIEAYAQTFKSLTATTTGATVQLTDRSGNKLYYRTGPVTATNYKLAGVSATVTPYPVIVNDWTSLTKLEFGHIWDALESEYLPQGIWGAGTGTGNNGKFIMTKRTAGMDMVYTTTSGDEVALKFTDYVDAKMRRMKTFAIDKTGGTVTYLLEGQTTGDEEVIDYTEDATSMTFTWADGFVCTGSIS